MIQRQTPKAVALALLSAFVTAPALAALPAGVEAAITTASTDGVTLLGLMVAGGIVVYVAKRVMSRFGISL